MGPQKYKFQYPSWFHVHHDPETRKIKRWEESAILSIIEFSKRDNNSANLRVLLMIHDLLLAPPKSYRPPLKIDLGQYCRLLDICTTLALTYPLQATETVYIILQHIRISQRQPDHFVFNRVLRFFSEVHDPSMVIRFWKEFRDQGLQSDISTFSIMVDLYKNEKTPGDNMRRLLNDFHRLNVIPDAWLLIGMMDNLSYHLNRAGFEVIFAEVQKLGCFTTDLRSLNIGLKSLGRFHDVTRGIQLYEQARKAGLIPDMITFFALLHLCQKALDSSLAWRLFEEFKQLGLQPNDKAMCRLLQMMVETEDRTGFDRTILEAENLQYFPHNEVLMNIFLRGAGKFHFPSYALQIFDEAFRAGFRPSALTFYELICLCLMLNDSQRALQLFEQFKSLASGPDSKVFSPILTLMINADDHEGFQHVMMEAERCGALAYNKNVLDVCIKGVAHFGNPAGAMQLFRNSLQLGPPPDRITFTNVINLCRLLKDPNEAWILFDQFRRMGIVATEFVFSSLLTVMIECNSRDGFFRAVEELSSANVPTSPIIWNSLIQGYMLFIDDRDNIFSILDGMRALKQELTPAILLSLLEGFARRKDIENANRIFRQFRAEGVAVALFHFTVLLKLAVELKDESRFEDTVKMLGESGVSIDAQYRRAILKYRVKLGQVDKIYAIYEQKIKNNHIIKNLELFNEALYVCVQAKDIARAKRILQDMEQFDVKPNERSCQLVLNAMVFGGQTDEECENFVSEMRDRYQVSPKYSVAEVRARFSSANTDEEQHEHKQEEENVDRL